MHPDLEKLVNLQELDKRRAMLQRLLKKRPEAISTARNEAEKAAKKVQEKQDALTKMKASIDLLDTKVQEIENKIQKLLSQQRKVKNNKEYQAINHEILNLKADRGQIEQQMLELFQVVEKAEEELERLNLEARELDKKATEKEKELDADVQESAEELKRLEEERDKAFQALQPEHAQVYAQLYQRDGRAVVPVVNDACQGCFMHVPPEIISKLLADSGQLVLCRSCGRILYLEQEERTQ